MSAAKRVDRPFVKSSDTRTPVVNSRSEVDKLLRRYGASHISMSEDIEAWRIIVSFVVPNSAAKNAVKVPVKLPVSVHDVYHALYGKPTRGMRDSSGQWVTAFDPKGYDAKMMDQAERVAWRNLVLWLDAALSAATIGLQTITEAFFAHTVVGDGGTRMVEVVEQFQSQLGTGVQRLLTTPAGPEPGS